MEFRLADLGEGMAEAEIVRWLVAEGAEVAEDDPLLEVETDKSLVQIPSPVAGRVTARGAAEGERVPVGAVLAVIETSNEELAGGNGAAADPHSAASVPVLGEAPEKDVGAIVGNLDNPGMLSVEDVPPTAQPDAASGHVVAASPATRRLARELGVELSGLRGTGPDGRVTPGDVRAADGRPVAPRAAPLTNFGQRIPLRGLRGRIAEHMAAAHRLVPQVTVVEEVDATDLVHLRTRLNDAAAAPQSGHAAKSASAMPQRVSYLPFFAVAAMRALALHPILNSSLDEERNEIVVHPHIHLGIAVDTADGLMVAVVPEAEHRSVQELARDLPPLAESARQRALPPDRLRGSTFTITSAGSLGGIFATPIVNHPEVAILGIHRIVERPGMHEGRIEPRRMMHISLSFDHRVLDGAEASRYVADLAALIENPYGLLCG